MKSREKREIEEMVWTMTWEMETAKRKEKTTSRSLLMPSMSFLSHLTIQINVKDHPFSVELQIKKY